MKKHRCTIIITLAFLAGLSVLLYPTVASYINSGRQSRAVESYHEAVRKLDERDYSDLLGAARVYNEALRGKAGRFRFSRAELMEYMGLLNIAAGGVMGTLEIESINVRLPIYHGTSEAVLQIGAGHLEGTSLPVGGPGTHAGISGHRGLPSSILLTNIDRLAPGDTFLLRVLSEKLHYQIDRILTVDPDDMQEMEIAPDMDYCTLITCTPYGINSHRLLVRGFRVDAPREDGGPDTVAPEAEGLSLSHVAVVVLAPILIVLLIVQAEWVLKKHGGIHSP